MTSKRQVVCCWSDHVLNTAIFRGPLDTLLKVFAFDRLQAV